MLKQNAEIVKAVLSNDSTVSGVQKEQVLAILTGSPQPAKPVLLTQAETAKFLAVSRQTVWNMTKSGYLKPAVLPNGQRRFRVRDLEKLTGIEDVNNG